MKNPKFPHANGGEKFRPPAKLWYIQPVEMSPLGPAFVIKEKRAPQTPVASVPNPPCRNKTRAPYLAGLVQLAPEMAEAITAFNDFATVRAGHLAHIRLEKLAKKIAKLKAAL